MVLAAGIVLEARSSTLQGWLFSSYAAKLSFVVDDGPSPTIVFPRTGPFDEQAGYVGLPRFQERLREQGYRIVRQARFSPELQRLVEAGIPAPYPEPAATGLVIHGGGEVLFDARAGRRLFQDFDDIPAIVVDALQFIENRELGTGSSQSNPAVEWDRFSRAGLLYAGRALGLPVKVEGGGTLAVQFEKYRHFSGGRTYSGMDKLRQLIAASLRVYRDGTDITDERRRIILDYLNTMPLAARAGYGEVYGLGEGLYAWFGIDLDAVRNGLSRESSLEVRARALKPVLALLCATRAPSLYLASDPAALEARVNHYIGLMERQGLFEAHFRDLVAAEPIVFRRPARAERDGSFVERKAVNAARTHLLDLLQIPALYDLDRLHLEVETPIDAALQSETSRLLRDLRDPAFVEAAGLGEDRLLSRGDPAGVVYTLMLFERTPAGNLLRVQTDTHNQPFDMNQGMKLELGSTAKLRTLTHYLEIMAGLHQQLSGLDASGLAERSETAADPLTRWAAAALLHGFVDGDTFLRMALDREYSAASGETFFTGGGAHRFRNFDTKEDRLVLTVREAMRRSTNLVFIRLMRDLVRFHQARLPYDAEAVLNDAENPVRRRLLEEAADREAGQILLRAYRNFKGLTESELVERLLGPRADSMRHLTILFFAWNPAENETGLARWLEARLGSVPPEAVARMARSYDPKRLNLADYGYLLGPHPLEVWTSRQLVHRPDTTWEAMLSESGEARQVVRRWLLRTRNRRAQDVRPRARIEQDVFQIMTPYWQRLGFPFDALVPSYATAIGSSSDRPTALAELMGIILNDGVRYPMVLFQRLHFAKGTPYETVFEPVPAAGERVMAAPVARALRQVLSEVVDEGTARRLAGTFALPQGGKIVAGGKTGSGDNRYRVRGPDGVIASRAVNRTATFAFYIGDRYFGAVTAFVNGRAAENYSFTSALPVTTLKLLAPSINERLAGLEDGETEIPPASPEDLLVHPSEELRDSADSEQAS